MKQKFFISFCAFLLALSMAACTGAPTPTTQPTTEPAVSQNGLPISPGFTGNPVMPNGSGEPSTKPTTPDATAATTPDGSTLPSTAPTQAATIPTTPDGSCAKHADANNDGGCDVCGVTVVVYFDFYALNDLHGKFDDTDANPGVDELTTYLKNAESANQNTILLASGDMWQGSGESNATYGAVITEWMNEMDFTAMTLGNHDFDWGVEYIKNNAALAEFPFLALNVYDRATNKRVDYCQNSVMVEADGVKIGIIGAIGDCYSSIFKEHVEDIYFKTGSELTALVKQEATKLRNRGADFIVYSVHDGFGQNLDYTTTINDGRLSSYYDPELSNGYVDLVFEGHIHKRYVFRDASGVYHLQGGGENAGISHATVKINTANQTSHVVKAEYVANANYKNLADDPLVDNILDKYQDKIAPVGKVLGKNDFVRDSDALCALAAQLYYEKGKELWGSDYTVSLGGGFFNVRSPWELSAGNVTYAQLQALFPFDNQLVLCSTTGANLRKVFLETDNSNYHTYHPDLNAVDPSATYYIVTDVYTSTYRPNNLTELQRYDKKLYARDLIADYVAAGGLTGSQDSPSQSITPIAEIHTIGNALADNALSPGGYYVKGKVQSINNTIYGNMTIVDENGDSLYIYGVYDATGKRRYDVMENPPQVGETVILYGQIQKYIPASGVPLVEIVRANMISKES